MKQIKLLDPETIDQIAAGEVVERPSSVVKELTENAIDAGATAITIEIRDGGKSFIRITDNGEGIAADQVRTAFAAHATSKITSASDLPGVITLGFRGEALSSISAVSQTELITKTPGALIGTRYLIEGGKETVFEEIGAPEGSTFLVKNLFYNTPVRQNFLKSPSTEGAYISELAEHLALSHPEISFKLIVSGQTKLHTSGNGQLKDVIYHLYGREIAGNLLPVEAQTEGLTLSGFIGKPAVSRGNRNYENYFVGGRYVRDKIIANAIEEGYRTFMMQHRYPFTALFLTVEGEHVDVNVHPAKREVRFSDGEAVYRLVKDAVQDALTHRELIRPVTPDSEAQVQREHREERAAFQRSASKTPEPFEKLRRDYLASSDSPYQPKYGRTYGFTMDEILQNEKSSMAGGEAPTLKGRFGGGKEETADQTSDAHTSSTAPGSSAALVDIAPENDIQGGSQGVSLMEGRLQQEELSGKRQPDLDQPRQLGLFEDDFLSQEAAKKHRLIGQVFDTYWLIEYEDKLYIIDQHAAHEKVLYEKFVQAYKEKTFTSQLITPSIVVTLNAAEQEKLKTFADEFTRIGFVVEPFGGNDFAIKAVPDNLYGFTDKELFMEMLDSLGEDVHDSAADQLMYHLATMACKAAVKGGMPLSEIEADALIGELLSLENPYNCPHGRPTIISMSRHELEKKFKRII